ncbi:MAG: cbb3-type cytochrome c oxidase subunit I [Woeseiaceae bacterium]|nr:cbb3-type cytochrome c oxidase subunit I [Woeseiaceae bacterium]
MSDTYFVVAHFHMVMGVSPILVVFGAIYHWFPKITGRMYNETIGRWHFWLTFLGTYADLPAHALPRLPRRAAALLRDGQYRLHAGIRAGAERRHHSLPPSSSALTQLLFFVQRHLELAERQEGRS